MPDPKNIHVDVPLTNLAIQYKNLEFIADKVFPIVPVIKESDKYYKFSREELREIDSARADGDTAKQIEWDVTTETYSAKEYALKKLLTDRTIRNSDAAVRPQMTTVNKLMKALALGYERRVSLAITSSGASGSTPAAGKKWDESGAEIETNIDTAKQSIISNAGVKGNMLILNTAVKDAFKKDSTIRNLIRYTIAGQGGEQLLRNGELPPVVFGLEVVLAEATYNAGKFGGTDSITAIWPNTAIVCYSEPAPSLDALSLGYTFRVGTPITKTWRDEERAGQMIEVSFLQAEKIVASQACYLLHSVLA